MIDDCNIFFILQSFLTNSRGYPCLSKRHQKLLEGFFNHSVQVPQMFFSLSIKEDLVGYIFRSRSQLSYYGGSPLSSRFYGIDCTVYASFMTYFS